MAGKTVMTVGSFDILHIDHVELFAKCRELVGPDGKVLVGVNTNSFIEEYKGRSPLMWESDRLMLVNAIRYVDDVFLNDDTSLEWCLDAYGPDYLAIGSDWFAPERDYMAQIGLTWQQMADYVCSVVVIPSRERVHSSDFRQNAMGEPVLIGQKVVLTDEGIADD